MIWRMLEPSTHDRFTSWEVVQRLQAILSGQERHPSPEVLESDGFSSRPAEPLAGEQEIGRRVLSRLSRIRFIRKDVLR